MYIVKNEYRAYNDAVSFKAFYTQYTLYNNRYKDILKKTIYHVILLYRIMKEHACSYYF